MTEKLLRSFTLAAVIIVAVGLFAICARAQETAVPRWQHSIFMPGYTFAKAPDKQWHGAAFAGMGYQTLWTVYDKGQVNVIGIGLNHVINTQTITDSFIYTIGLDLSFGGNFDVGAGYDMINTESQTGLVTGWSSWDQNGKLYLAFHLPLNGGGLVNVWKNN